MFGTAGWNFQHEGLLMLKKMVILAVVGFVAVTAISGTKLASYLRNEARSLREHAEDSIPPEKELSRLKHEVELLDRDRKSLTNQLAKQVVEVRMLQKEVDDLVVSQTQAKATLQARAEAIKAEEKNGTQQISTVNVAKARLEADVKMYADKEKVLESKKSELTIRINVREELARQHAALDAQKQELKSALNALEAKIALNKARQIESKVQTDDSRLARIKDDVRALQKRLEIEDTARELSQPGGTEADAFTGGKSVDEIMSSVNGPAKKPEAANTPKADTKKGD